MIKFLNTKTQKMSAAFITGAIVGLSDTASAQETLNTYMSTTSQNVNAVPDVVAFLSYLGGTALAALGIVSLKQHVEQGGQQKPMKDGLAKLGFGGMLIALPAITDVMFGTVETGGEATFQGFSSDASF